MLETSARLLRLLALLQGRRDWTGAQLAERLGVTTRTVRNDVDRLRTLGYPVDATPGAAGGYRLGAGASLPPLLLDDDEAVAVAVGLGAAAGGSVAGVEEASARALAKLEPVLPGHLRHRVQALRGALVTVPATGPRADAAVLQAIAAAVRDRVGLRFDYVAHDGGATRRRVEPHHLVHARNRWYLVAWDLDRDDWRTFRADRVVPSRNTGPRFEPRAVPGGDVAAHVLVGLAQAVWQFRADVTVHAPAEVVVDRLPDAASAGVVEAVDDHTCRYATGADSPGVLALYLGLLDLDFTVDGPPELLDQLTRLAGRYARAARGTGRPGGGPASRRG